MKRRKPTFIKKKIKKRNVVFSVLGLLAASTVLGLSLHFPIESEIVTGIPRKVVFALDREEFLTTKTETLSTDLSSVGFGNLLEDAGLQFELKTDLTDESRNAEISKWTQSETSVQYRNSPVQDDGFATFSKSRKNASFKSNHNRAVPVLPAESLKFTTGNEHQKLILTLQCLGAASNRRDMMVPFSLGSNDGKSFSYTIAASSREAQYEFESLGLSNEYTLNWEAEAPCLLLVKGLHPATTRSQNGIVLVTVDELPFTEVELAMTHEALKKVYGEQKTAAFFQAWPFSTSKDENLGRILLGSTSDEVSSQNSFPGSLQLSVPRRLSSLLRKESWRKVLVNVGNDEYCESAPCEDNKSLFAAEKGSEFDSSVTLIREKYLEGPVTQYFSQTGPLSDTFLNLNFAAQHQKMALTWHSALNSKIPLGKWVAAGFLNSIHSEIWRTSEFQQNEKASQIDASLASFILKLPRATLPHIAIAVHRNNASHLKDVKPDVPFSTGAVLVASPTATLPQFKKGDIPSFAALDVFFENIVTGSANATESKISETWKIDSDENEIYLRKNGDTMRWLSLDAQRTFETPKPSDSNLEIKEFPQFLDFVRQTRTQINRTSLYFKVAAPIKKSNVFALALSGPLRFEQCFASKQSQITRIAETKEAYTLTSSFIMEPNVDLAILCYLTGKPSDEQNFVLSATLDDVAIPANLIGVGQFAEPVGEANETLASWKAQEFLDRSAAEIFPRTELLKGFQLYIWRGFNPSVLMTEAKKLVALVSEHTSATTEKE